MKLRVQVKFVFYIYFRRIAKEKTWQVLNREVTELQCQESKTQVLLDIVSRSVNRVGDGEAPKAIELDEAPPPPEVRLNYVLYQLRLNHQNMYLDVFAFLLKVPSV